MEPDQTRHPQPKIKIYVDPDYQDLIPSFLKNREQDVLSLETALAQKEFKAIRKIGHDLKGMGGGYGFDAMTEMGGELEECALQKNEAAISATLKKFKNYLESVEVIYSLQPKG